MSLEQIGFAPESCVSHITRSGQVLFVSKLCASSAQMVVLNDDRVEPFSHHSSIRHPEVVVQQALTMGVVSCLK